MVRMRRSSAETSKAILSESVGAIPHPFASPTPPTPDPIASGLGGDHRLLSDVAADRALRPSAGRAARLYLPRQISRSHMQIFRSLLAVAALTIPGLAPAATTAAGLPATLTSKVQTAFADII